VAAVSVPELDLSQQRAARVELGSRQLVIAGPGSGKTEVVAALVAQLVEDQDADPELSLLVVSFSRAAVYAVTRRLRASDIQAAAAVRTIDSLARQIVRESYGEEIVGRDQFDRTIARALQALRAGDWDRLEDLEHVVVDEVQDVVGLRAEFLLALLDQLPARAGFTLLGDPAQAIYDFQLTPEHPTTSNELMERVTAMTEVQRRELTGSYRAGTRDAAAAVSLRTEGDGSLQGAEEAVQDFTLAVTPIDDDGLALLASRQGKSLAVLTATNGQALLEAHDLWRRGVAAQVRRPLTAPVVDAWVAQVLGGTGNWSFSDFVAAVGDEAIALERWRGLRTWIAPGARTLETREVARRIRSATAPGELLVADADGPIVSTIHRAKGLEFESVVMTEYDRAPQEQEDGTGNARVQYVALTRARFRLMRIRRNRYPTFVTRHKSTGRWLRCWSTAHKVRAVEVRGDDLDRTRPPGPDVELAQAHLRDRVRPGDPVTLVHDWTSSDETPFWDVLHEGVTIGRTTAQFGTDLRRILAGRLSTDLLEVHVECVETVAGDPTPAAPSGVGSHGLWLGARLVGFAVREWKEEA